MSIISIFRPSGPRTASELRKALAEAEAARQQADARLEALCQERASALLVSDDTELDRIEAAQSTASRELDRLGAALAELHRRLPIAEQNEAAAARAKAWAAFEKRHRATDDAFVATAEAALVGYEKLIAVFTEAEAAGFGREIAASFSTPPGVGGGVVIDRLLLDRYKADRARIASAAAAKPKVAVTAPAAKPTMAPDARGDMVPVLPESHRRVQIMPAAPVPTVAPRPAVANGPLAPANPPRRSVRAPHKITGPVPEQHRAIAYLRSGVELADGSLSVSGDELAIPADEARRLVEAGAADFITPPADTGTTQKENA